MGGVYRAKRLLASSTWLTCAAIAVVAIASAVLKPCSASAADDSATNKQDSASPPTTRVTPNKSGFSGNVHPMMISGEYFLSSTANPKARCKQSELTQETFLEMVHAIVEHGDLTDKAFIEKTLQITFGPKHESFVASHTPDAGLYYTDMPSTMRDAPIKVNLYLGGLDEDKTGKPELSEELTLDNLNMVGAVFRNCQYLTKKQFQQNFPGISFHTNSGHDSGVLDLGKVGKNDSDIEMTVQISDPYMTDNTDAISQVAIDQRSESIPNK
jgi:hypothetical protein